MSETARLIVSLAGVALYVAAGLGLVSFVPSLRRRPLGERLGWAWLLGVTFVAGGSFAVSHFFHVPLRRHLFLPLALAPVLVGLILAIRGRKEGVSVLAERPRRRGLLSRLAIGAAVLATIALFGEALTNPIRDFDGRMTWSTQARYFRAEGSVSPRALTEERWYVSHPQYPPLLPLMQVGAMEVFDAPADERVPRPLYAAFLPAYLLVLFGAARRWAGTRAAALATLAATLTPFLVFASHGGPAGCYSDFPLSCFLGSGLLLFLAPGGAATGAGAGLLLGGAVLAKNEGLPLAFAFFAAGLIPGLCRVVRGRRSCYRRFARKALASGLLVAASAALLVSWRAGIPNRYDERYELLLKARHSAAQVAAHLEAALPTVVSRTFDPADWGLLWVALPLVLVAGRRGLRHPAGPSLLVAASASAVLAIAVYALHWNPSYLAGTTWSRFLVDLSLPAFVLFALAARRVFFVPRQANAVHGFQTNFRIG